MSKNRHAPEMAIFEKIHFQATNCYHLCMKMCVLMIYAGEKTSGLITLRENEKFTIFDFPQVIWKWPGKVHFWTFLPQKRLRIWLSNLMIFKIWPPGMMEIKLQGYEYLTSTVFDAVKTLQSKNRPRLIPANSQKIEFRQSPLFYHGIVAQGLKFRFAHPVSSCSL